MDEIFTPIIQGFHFTGDIRKDSYNLLINHKRFIIAEHTLRVWSKAKSLAKIYEIDEEAAETSAFLHDIGGIYLNEERYKISKALGIEVVPEEEVLPLILHQKISAVMARELFNINDERILSAISCHTTLKANASKLDMLIFLADKIEWDQKGTPPYLEEIEKALPISLELAAFRFIKYQLSNKNNLKVIHPWLAIGLLRKDINNKY